MKRITFTLLAALIGLSASAFKIEKDEIDEFTGKRTLITSWEHFKSRRINMRFRLQNGVQWLDFKLMDDYVYNISKDDELQFKTVDNTIFTLYAAGNARSGNWGISASYHGDLESFRIQLVRLIRLHYNTYTYSDYEFNDKEAKKLQELYIFFDVAINGDEAKPAFEIIYQSKQKNSTKWDNVDTEYRETLTDDEISAIRSEWESKTNADIEYRVQIKRKKTK